MAKLSSDESQTEYNIETIKRQRNKRQYNTDKVFTGEDALRKRIVAERET